MERIVIKNFGGIDYLDIEINRINIFIGKEATGKSVTAKLLYFFREIFTDILIGSFSYDNQFEIEKEIIVPKFEKYFPMEIWANIIFNISYTIGNEYVNINNTKQSNLKIEYSDKIKGLFTFVREIGNEDKAILDAEVKLGLQPSFFRAIRKYLKHIQSEIESNAEYDKLFIPAGRSFFANLQSSIFLLLSNNQNIDPFLIEFGKYYESIKHISTHYFIPGKEKLYDLIDLIAKDILKAEYIRDKDKDFLIHEGDRKVNLLYSSSGQQEILPLILILKLFADPSFFSKDSGKAVFIEEPETHLFPDSQKKIVELISLVFNNSESRLQFVITTHSPYILTSFNNLMQAGEIEKRAKGNKGKLAKLYKIVPKEMILAPEIVSAYEFDKKTARSITNKKTKLIKASHIDTVSEEIGLQFDELLSLY